MATAAGRILLTGSTGFVGRHLLRTLLAMGEPVTLALRRPADAVRWQQHPAIRAFVTGDLESADLGSVCEGVDRVVHLAGLAAAPSGDAQAAERALVAANVTATERLAAAARANGVRLFIHMSSVHALTANATDETMNDASMPGPVTGYGRSKLAAEARVAALADDGCAALSLRPPLVIGADASGNWRLLQRLAASNLPLPFAALTARRSFVSIETLCDAVAGLCAARVPAGASGAYCIADPDAMSLPELLVVLRQGMGLPRRLFPMPKAAFDLLGATTGRRRQMAGLTGPLVVDATRFFATFGIAPALPLAEAVRRSGRDYRRAVGGEG